MLEAVGRPSLRTNVVLFRPTNVEEPEITHIAPFTSKQTSTNGKAVAYVCKRYSCLEPTSEIKKMLEMLDL